MHVLICLLKITIDRGATRNLSL